jgi:hypothetical protein
MSFHANRPEQEYWYNFTDKLMDSNGGVHNELCKIDSKSCSKEMSGDVADLCEWHRIRMARHVVLSCGCKKWDLCSGDSTGRVMFRNYYDCWKMPVIDSIGKVYCCGTCQNCDVEKYQCGEMLVGDCCFERHSECVKL